MLARRPLATTFLPPPFLPSTPLMIELIPLFVVVAVAVAVLVASVVAVEGP
jgi:hypothetical protein